MSKAYKIVRPHYALDPRYNGEDILCRHLQDATIIQWRHYFETYNWEEIYFSSIEEARTFAESFLRSEEPRMGGVFVQHGPEIAGEPALEIVYNGGPLSGRALDGSEQWNNHLYFFGTILEVQ